MQKTKFNHRVIAIFFTLNFLTTILPWNQLHANNNGPNAPEASGFEPVDATDMVNIATGDTAYVLPLVDVGGFPVTLSYHSGIPLDMESSWVGLGWNLNTGAIARGVSATPDDWNAAKTLDFIYFQDSDDFYSINVGVGISQAAEVGVGIAWGSNKSLSGSVYASYMGANASISTDGNYSVGFGVGFGSKGQTDGMGVGVSVSGNINGGKKTVGIGVGGRTGNMTGSLGVSLSDSGASFSISAGYSNKTSYDQGQAGGAGISVGNYSSGDFDVSSKGFYIPIQIYMFNIGFGHQKVTYTLKKGYDKTGFGILYSGNSSFNDPSVNNEVSTMYNFSDYQNRYVYTDMYDQALPQSEEEYVADTRPESMKLNFSYAAYDTYEINATGIIGSMKPKIFENATLFGLGYKGAYPNSGDDKMRVYYHNSKGTGTTNYLPTKNLGNNFIFYFDGQFTQRTEINPLNYTTDFSFNSDTNKSLRNYLPTGRITDNTRKKGGNFVEVYTNQQIRTGQAFGLMEPDGLSHSSRTNADFIDSGIGGYKVTSPDGKTYHFSLPVYSHERVERTILQDNSGNNVNEKRQFTPYATHWLLTAITGPDFIDVDGNNFPNENDFGYWVRLDYGKWSNSFTWRSPYSGVNYNTNIKDEIEEEDHGNWQYGRKDLYYLDRIVSQTHTAYFVKDIRYDATGATNDILNSTFTYSYTGTITVDNGSQDYSGHTPFWTSNPSQPNSPYVRENGIVYKREYQLLLDKIIIVPTKFDTVQKNQSIEELNKQYLPGYIANDSYQLNYDEQGGFYKERNARPTVKLHQENMVYDINDFKNFDYSKAIKTIQLNYDYELAKGSPSSFQCYNQVSSSNPANIGKGKLTLREVQFLGRNQYEYMPPYRFDYKGENFNYPVGHNQSVNLEVRKAKDEWGFIDEQYYLRQFIESTYGIGPDNESYEIYFNQHYNQFANTSGPDNWSLSKIAMPTGASINFEYEEDDYYTEAFARRVFDQGVSLQVREESGSHVLEMKNAINVVDDLPIKFTDYYQVGDIAVVDLWMYYDENHNPDDGGLDLNSKSLEVLQVSSNYVKFKLDIIENVDTHQHYWWKVRDIPWGPITSPPPFNFTIDGWYYGGHLINKGEQEDINGFDQDHWLLYKILATRVPKDQTGGGLRVKSINLKDENNNQYITKYFYNKPGTYKYKNQGDYESSGITSYAPVNGLKFIPYQSELPGPGVMYEYVTMRSESVQGIPIGETRYRFHTLQPVLDIFDPNLTMYDDQDNEIFKATVTNANNDQDGLLHSNQKVYAKKIQLDVNTSLVGQFRSIEEFNNEGHTLKKTEKHYLSGSELATYSNRGYVMESFESMKSVFKTDSDNNNPTLVGRYLSLSSRRDYTSVVASSTTTTQFGTTIESYSNADPETGAFRTTKTKLADGTFIKTDQIPAYTKYPSMGSKTVATQNKNMLTQGAMSIMSWSQYGNNNGWETLNANITTWNKNWKYRDSYGNETAQNDVWRKHKSFVWKDEVNHEKGTYLTVVDDNSPSNNYFDWGLGIPTNDKWQNVSETTRYTHWSAPLEVKDINGNYMSSKMADKDTKIIASGNASFTEMFYSGAEYDVNGTYLDQEIKGAQYRSLEMAHNGVYSLKITKGNKGFETTLKANEHSADNYKISVWVLGSVQNIKIQINGNVKDFNGESVSAGRWTQFNHYEFLDTSIQNISIVTNNANGVYSFIDDFRVHPVYASMNSYGYDDKTDELSYILDANNMSSKYIYDDAGRLCKSYKEVENSSSITGGFKLINQYNYHYEGIPNGNGCNCCENGNNQSNGYPPIVVKGLKEINKGAYNRVFEVEAHGGSGNFSYQWRWLTDFESNSYSTFQNGNRKQEIPFAVKFCDTKTNSYDKVWVAEVKIIDNVTGEIEIKNERIDLSGCKYYLNDVNWADLEISSNYEPCSSLNKYSFRPFVIKPDHKNYTYSYRSFNPISNLWSQYQTISSSDGNFCTDYYYAPSSDCKSEYSIYQTLQYRIMDNVTGSVFQSNVLDIYLDCAENPDPYLKLLGSEYHAKFNHFGNVVEKTLSGEVINMYNFSDKINNKN